MKKFKSIVLIIFVLFLSTLIISCSKKTTEPETNKVATPTISPETGIYDEAQEVSIQCSTQGATIRYTVDGSMPNSSSPLYSEPIMISSNVTIIAQAFKHDWIDSEFASAFFTITPKPEDVGMVYIPGGTFTMGKTNHEVEMDPMWDNDMHPHSVTLDSYYINKYQVTQSEYEAIMGSNPSHSYSVGNKYPVYYVSWYDAIKFCNLCSMREKLVPAYSIAGSTNPDNWGEVPSTGDDDSIWSAAICNWNANGYRLPTEAEWEYAARGATNNPDYFYSGSDNARDVAWYNENASTMFHVGTKAPNGLGIYDMSGNVFEWCWDWYGSSYYSSSPSNNPRGPASGSDRMIRGGCWSLNDRYCRVSNRSDNNPAYKNSIIGFRVCRSVN